MPTDPLLAGACTFRQRVFARCGLAIALFPGLGFSATISR
jgi:hypothetical protein